jgi:outer membrane protein TolC
MGIQAQLTIDECQAKARENYPLIKRYDLIKKSQEYTLSNAGKGYLPQFALIAKASYQSDVTSLPISVPGITVPTLSKDQYNAYIDVTQSLWDGGAIRAQKKIADSNAEVEQQQVNVDLYAIQDRVNQLFFGILLFNAQLNQNQIMQDELQRNFATVSSYIENGIANQADLDAVKVEQLKTKQNLIQIQSNKKAYMDMLSYMIGEPIDDNTSFIKPVADDLIVSNEINRPELQLFELQNKLFESQ